MCPSEERRAPPGVNWTPPPARTRDCAAAMPMSMSEKSSPLWTEKRDLFHIVHEVPSGDSPCLRAKHAQLIFKHPNQAISSFWAAINAGDRVDSALKDMAVVMNNLDRPDDGIEAIKYFRYLCSLESQESIDNLLLEPYKNAKCSRGQTHSLQSPTVAQAPTHGSSILPDFSFAFNQPEYSDRVLSIVIEAFCDVAPSTIREIQVNSLILSAKSTFFYKLFSNGMAESRHKQVRLIIDDPSEEYALTEVMKFIYSRNLTASKDPLDLVDVLTSADRFEVSCCVIHCVEELLNLPMTKKIAMEYINNIPWSVLMSPNVKPLVKAAQNVIANHYRDISWHPKEEIMSLPFLAIEGILSSDNLIIGVEDYVYNVLVAWTECNYSDPEKQKEILESLTHCIRFPYISSCKLEEILVSEDLNPEVASKLVLEALMFKTASRQRQRDLAAEKTDHQFIERKSYKYRSMQLLEFEEPHDESIVCLSLTREDFASLYPSGRLYSQGFNVVGNSFHLSLRCEIDEDNTHCLGLFLEQVKVPISHNIEYSFSLRTKPTEAFTEVFRGSTITSEGDACGCKMQWTTLMDEDSLYFINDIVHLRVEISVCVLL